MSDSGYIAVGQLDMYYEVHGTGEPLVLLHGGGSGISATFGRILPQLAQSHRVIGVEQQGHGHTADVDRPFSLEQMADDTAELLSLLDVSLAHVLGFSNGGQVAMYLALRHPDKVQKLVLASTFYHSEGVIPELQAAWAKQLKVEDMPPGLRDAYRSVAPHPDALQHHIDKSQQMMRDFRGIAPEDLKRITMPTLLINGDRDVIRLEHTLDMMNLIPGSRLVVLPGTHGAYIGELSTPIVNTRLPEITVKLVNEFLNGLAI